VEELQELMSDLHRVLQIFRSGKRIDGQSLLALDTAIEAIEVSREGDDCELCHEPHIGVYNRAFFL